MWNIRMKWKPYINIALIIVVFGALILIIVHRQLAHNANDEDIAKIVNHWVGKTVVLPLSVGRFTTNGDSLNTYFPQGKFTILRYVGKDGCSSCRLHLSRYPEILSELSDSAKCEIGFVCIINPAEMNEIRRILRRDNYAGLTMWIDESDSLNMINNFPEPESMQTFLIDRNNKVLAIGDPAVNPRIMRLYTQILTNDSINSAQLPITKLAVDQEEVQLGTIEAGDTIRQSVIVRNVGITDFVLDKVLTSCDCTTAELSADRIVPGGEALLHINFSEHDAIGEFYRIIDIFGNTQSAVSIEISGTVI